MDGWTNSCGSGNDYLDNTQSFKSFASSGIFGWNNILHSEHCNDSRSIDFMYNFN